MNHNMIVNESCRTLRGLAREALNGRWKIAALGSLIFFAVIMLPTAILDYFFSPDNSGQSGISTIYTILISGAMALGYAMFSIALFRKRETSVAEVLYGFEKFLKALGLYIVMNIFIMLWSSLYMVYLIVISIMTFTNMQSLSDMSHFAFLAICGLPLIIPGIIASLRYSLAYFVLADNPSIGILKSINESKRLMRGNILKLFLLGLSFIGWILLCIPTLGIALLWVYPYMEVSMVAFYDIANGSLRASNGEGSEIPSESSSAYTSDPVMIPQNNQNESSSGQQTEEKKLSYENKAPEQELEKENQGDENQTAESDTPKQE